VAQRVITQLVSDLSGEDLGSDKGETVQFAIDGKSLEIDLSHREAKQLRDALAKYIAAGRRTGSPAGRRRSSGTTSDAKQVREWAQSQGMAVPARGRIPADVRSAYENR